MGIVVASILLMCLTAKPTALGRGGGNVSPSDVTVNDIIFVEAPIISATELPERFPQGSNILRLLSGVQPDRTINLTPEFFAAADPSVSFDSTKILFSGQKVTRAPWQIWEMNVDGTNKHQLTKCSGDCIKAAYLPAGQIVYTVFSKENEARSESYLAVAKVDGSEVQRITFGPGGFEVGTVLRDGRVMALASWPLFQMVNGHRALYTLHPDGTALESFRPGENYRVAPTDLVEMDDDSIVFVERMNDGNSVGGKLVEIQRGAARDSSLGLSADTCVSAKQLAADKLIVACWNPSNQSTPRKFDLYSFNVKQGKLGVRIFGDLRLSSIQGVAVKRRPEPKILWSTLKPEAKAGYFICLDSRVFDDDANVQPQRSIAEVRLLAKEETGSKERVLGTAPVEPDGSFYVAVPADLPVRFELLDHNGLTIREEKSWIWVRSGEQRGCLGCHESKALTPENRWPLALKRFDTPTPLGVEDKRATGP